MKDRIRGTEEVNEVAFTERRIRTKKGENYSAFQV